MSLGMPVGSRCNRDEDRFALSQVISSASAPVSVAFGEEHLYVLGTATVESHRVSDTDIEQTPDGVTPLLHADGSAAQVGVVDAALVITEKSNIVEVAQLRSGVVSGSIVPVDLPAGSDTPFGLVTRGANAYVTIAHSDEIALITGGQLIDRLHTVTRSAARIAVSCRIFSAIGKPRLSSLSHSSASVAPAATSSFTTS